MMKAITMMGGGGEDILKVEWIVETFFSRWIFVSWRYSRFHALHKLTNSPLDRWIDGLDGSINWLDRDSDPCKRRGRCRGI